MLNDDRAGEAIGPLRRAANLGAPGDRVWPLLARAFVRRGRSVAALGAVLEARSAGVNEAAVREELLAIEAQLGPSLASWRDLVLQPFVPRRFPAVPYLAVNASRSRDGKTVYLMVVNKDSGQPRDARIATILFLPPALRLCPVSFSARPAASSLSIR